MGLADNYPDLYEMLTTPGTWEHLQNPDQWGNETFTPPVPIQCYVAQHHVDYGLESGNDRQQKKQIVNVEIITDAFGASLGDRVTVDGVAYYVNVIDAPKDVDGTDLMYTLHASTAPKG